ncbi:DUF7940 domain-containing protein [Rhodoblastus sp.]|uniref:DUF7940 domain-containing protein n=1 Tax=Rhodoblastus sp. TaxID=1962975 RepID=UPI003F9A13D9
MKTLARALASANDRLDDDWKDIVKTAWSIRVAGLWIAIGAVIFVAPMVSDEAKQLIGVWPFAGGLFLASVSFGVARILKQPGTDGQ